MPGVSELNLVNIESGRLEFDVSSISSSATELPEIENGVLDDGANAFSGSASEFSKSDRPSEQQSPSIPDQQSETSSDGYKEPSGIVRTLSRTLMGDDAWTDMTHGSESYSNLSNEQEQEQEQDIMGHMRDGVSETTDSDDDAADVSDAQTNSGDLADVKRNGEKKGGVVQGKVNEWESKYTSKKPLWPN